MQRVLHHHALMSRTVSDFAVVSRAYDAFMFSNLRMPDEQTIEHQYPYCRYPTTYQRVHQRITEALRVAYGGYELSGEATIPCSRRGYTLCSPQTRHSAKLHSCPRSLHSSPRAQTKARTLSERVFRAPYFRQRQHPHVSVVTGSVIPFNR